MVRVAPPAVMADACVGCALRTIKRFASRIMRIQGLKHLLPHIRQYILGFLAPRQTLPQGVQHFFLPWFRKKLQYISVTQEN